MTKFSDDELVKACFQNDSALIAEFLTQGGDPNQIVRVEATLGYFAASYDKIDILRLLVEHGAKLDGLLVAAAYRDHTVTISYLLGQGADPNEIDVRLRETPLTEAARSGQINTVRLLLDNGADVNKPNGWQQTPLMEADWGSYEAISQVLKDAGARSTPENNRVLRYPWMRDKLIWFLEKVIDQGFQRRIWVQRVTPLSNLDYASFPHEMIHFFYDHLMLNESPEHCIGILLHDKKEVKAIKKLMMAFDIVLDNYEAESWESPVLDEMIRSKEWSSLVKQAQIALAVLHKNS